MSKGSQFYGSKRIPLVVGNPLSKDISLYYCGAKKYKSTKKIESKAGDQINSALGKFIMNKLIS